MMDLEQLTVFSDSEGSVGALGTPTHPPRTTFTPKVALTTVEPIVGSNTQPTITVKRKILGALGVSPAEVTAGSKQDFTITYTSSEALVTDTDDDDEVDNPIVIEVRLPAWDADPSTPAVLDPPTPYQLADTKPKTEQPVSYVYLSGSANKLAGTIIRVVNGAGESAFTNVVPDNGMLDTRDENTSLAEADPSWIVRIELGHRDVSNRGTIVLKYNDVIVQRVVATDAETTDTPPNIQAFSGPSDPTDSAVADLPQFPVKEQAKDIITVKHAAGGSGTVTFALDDDTDVTYKKGSLLNSRNSIPAGITKDDDVPRSLIATYTPEGDMGDGEFEIQLPSGWDASEVIVSGAEDMEKDGNTVTATFPVYFGEQAEALDITFVDITVPNKHGDHGFLSKSKNTGGSLKQLTPKPAVFVGNTDADNDTVEVEITPAAAYQNQDNVDFDIVLTASGPMHDSDIEITVPEGITSLQTGKPAEENYVRKVSASVSGVGVSVDDLDDEIIRITTAKLNTGGKIRVRLDNVDLDGVTPTDSDDSETGFQVRTRTRGDEIEDPDDATKKVVDLAAEKLELIEATDGKHSIVGGQIRTVAGSGTMVIEPATIEQGSRNRNIKLTFTATTNFEKLELIIEVPSVIETELQEEKSSDDGYVSTSTAKFDASIKAADRLQISGSQIKWVGVTLRKGSKFVTNIKRVDLLEDTGPAPWVVTLGPADGGVNITDAGGAAANPPMVVVGTMQDDVAFEIVDESDIPNSNPSYPASSLQSIRFKFTTEDTAIQAGGRLWFTVPVGWSLPSLTDKTGKATVGILAYDDDDEEIFVKQLPKTGEADAGSNMALSVSGRSVILTIGAKGGLAEDKSVTIRYGDSDDPKKFPVQISASAKGTTSDGDGLAIRGHFRVSDDFRQRDAGTIWADVTNVVDGSGTAALSSSPATVRAGSKRNTITVTFTGTGTMDGGAVRLTIPEDWGAMQEDPLELNHIDVDISGTGAALTDSEILDDGLQVVANLKTFGKGNKVTFTYGGGTGARDSRGARAQADIGEAAFMIESMGSSDGDFVDIREDDIADSTNPLLIEVKGAESGSGEGVVEIMASKAGAGLYDGETDVDNTMMQVHAGDDSTYLVFTYTPSQTIAEGQLRFTVPSTWTPPQNDATDDPGYTYLEEIGSAVVANETYDTTTQSVVADISLSLDDQIKIHYGAENGGAEAPDAVPVGGYSQFAISVKGTLDDDDDDNFENIDGEDIMVMVRVQRSGGGMACSVSNDRKCR